MRIAARCPFPFWGHNTVVSSCIPPRRRCRFRAQDPILGGAWPWFPGRLSQAGGHPCLAVGPQACVALASNSSGKPLMRTSVFTC